MKQFTLLLLICLLATANAREVVFEVEGADSGSRVSDLVVFETLIELQDEMATGVADLFASPMRGSAPLDSTLSLSAQGANVTSWRLDVGDDGSFEYAGNQDLTKSSQLIGHTFTADETWVKLETTHEGGAQDTRRIRVVTGDEAEGGLSLQLPNLPELQLSANLGEDPENDAYYRCYTVNGEPVPPEAECQLIEEFMVGFSAFVALGIDVKSLELNEISSSQFKLDLYMYDFNQDSFTGLTIEDPSGGPDIGLAFARSVRICVDHHTTAGFPEGICYSIEASETLDGFVRSEISVYVEDGGGFCSMGISPPVLHDRDNGVISWTLSRSYFDVSYVPIDLTSCTSDPLVRSGTGIRDGDTVTSAQGSAEMSPSSRVSLANPVDSTTDGGETYTFGPQTPPPNIPPTASLGANVSEGPAPLSVEFTLGASDIDGTIVQWQLDFDGDGFADEDGAGVPPAKIYTNYTAVKTHVAELKVFDDDGASATKTVDIIVTSPGGGGEEPPEDEPKDGQIEGTLRVHRDSCAGPQIVAREIGPIASGRVRLTTALDMQALPVGWNDLAFCFTDDEGQLHGQFFTYIVSHSDRSSAGTAPAPTPTPEQQPYISSVSGMGLLAESTGTIQVTVVNPVRDRALEIEVLGQFASVNQNVFQAPPGVSTYSIEVLTPSNLGPTQLGLRLGGQLFITQVSLGAPEPMVNVVSASFSSNTLYLELENLRGVPSIVPVQLPAGLGTEYVQVPVGETLLWSKTLQLQPFALATVQVGNSFVEFSSAGSTISNPVVAPTTSADSRIIGIHLAFESDGDAQKLVGRLEFAGALSGGHSVELQFTDRTVFVESSFRGAFETLVGDSVGNVTASVAGISETTLIPSEDGLANDSPMVPLAVVLLGLLVLRRLR